MINNLSNMPQIASALSGWMSQITMKKITQSIVDGYAVDTERPFAFRGVIQPLSPQKIALKPEGERAWKWLQIHCQVGAENLSPADKIVYNGERYKVMGKFDYSLNGYVEYHAVKDYE